MKKLIKWLSIGIISLIVLIVGILVVVPIFFKDEIQAIVNEQCEQNVDAQVNIDVDKFSLSIFKNFPNITASIEDLEVIGNGEFSRDTLVSASSLSLSLDVMSVVFGDSIKINGIYLDKPHIYAHLNKRNKANWDIYKGSTSEEDTTESKPVIFLGIKEWAITDGKVTYKDQYNDVFAEINQVTHSGSGIISDGYLLNTLTSFGGLTVDHDGVSYLHKHKVDSKLDAKINSENTKFTFNENFIQLNDFRLAFDGSVELLEQGQNFDLKFNTTETEFKEILSLIPSIYQDELFDKITTKGTFGLGGFVKGQLTETKIPTFDVDLNIKDGFFQYPDLPKSINNINLNLKAFNKDGNQVHTGLDLSKLHLEFGDSPIDAKATVQNLVNTIVDAEVKGKLKLDEVSDYYPIEDLVLKGLLSVDAKMKGNVNPDLQQIPQTNVQINIANGYVKSGDYPAIEKLTLISTAFAEGDMNSLKANVQELDIMLDGQHFTASGDFSNLDDLNYDVKANGLMDLEKLMHVFPIEGTVLKGVVDIDHFYTKGKMSDILEEKYLAVKTGGKVKIKDFEYTEEEILPMGFRMTDAVASFTPANFVVESLNGTLGKSDLKANGKIENYMGYVFSETDTIIKGEFTMSSNSFNVDEWMTEDGESSEEVATDSDEEVVPVPKSIDFVVDATVANVVYDGMDIKDAAGQLLIKNGICTFKDGKVKVFGAPVVVNGSYDTENPIDPAVAFKLGIDKLELSKVAQYFETAKKYLPTANSLDGRFSGDINYSSKLNAGYMPNFETLNALGDVKLFNTSLKASKINMLSAIESKFPLNLGEVDLHGTKVKFKIEDGKLKVEPFDVKGGETNMKVSLAKGLTGSIDHLIKIDAPAKIVQNFGSQFLGNSNLGDRVNFDMFMKGTETNPLISLDGQGAVKNQVKDAVNDKVDAEKEKLRQEMMSKAKQQADRVRAEAKTQADKVRAEAKNQAANATDEGNKQVEKLRAEGYNQAKSLEDKASNVFEKRAAKIAADKIRKETDKKVVTAKSKVAQKASKIEDLGNNNAKKIEDQAEKRAQQIEDEAKQKADKI